MVGGIVAMALIMSISAKQIFMRNKFWNYSIQFILVNRAIYTGKSSHGISRIPHFGSLLREARPIPSLPLVDRLCSALYAPHFLGLGQLLSFYFLQFPNSREIDDTILTNTLTH